MNKTLFWTALIGFFCNFMHLARAKMPLKVGMAQLDPIAGHLEYNFQKIREAYERGVAAGLDVVVTPELALESYTSGDLFEIPEYWDRSEKYLERLRKLTIGKKTALLVGHISKNPGARGKPLQNDASAFVDGRLDFRHSKMLLPDYDVFNDARWFHPGSGVRVWNFRGNRIGVAICEDWWGEDSFTGAQGQRHYYNQDPAKDYRDLGVDLAISLSASPYGRDKAAYRERIHAAVARSLKAPFIWNGMSGATDGLLFDGRSFVLDANGNTVDRLAHFATDFAVVNFPKGPGLYEPIEVVKDSTVDTNPEELEIVYQALLSGIREYIRRTKQTGFVIGVSGGVDSAVATALLTAAIGAENVIGVSLPSRFSSEHSKGDGFALMERLGLPKENRRMLPIEGVHASAKSMFGDFWQDGASIDENTQARIRQFALNGIANSKPGYTVAVTGNKTEYAMGYFTFGGDDKGGLGILGGLWKSEVYELARYINRRAGREVIPYNTITKPASAELSPDQISYGDPHGMPPYEILDPLLRDYFEFRVPVNELHRRYASMQLQRPADWVYQVINKAATIPEFKRRQSAPLLRVDARKTFDWVGRRMPIAKQAFFETPALDVCERGIIPVLPPKIEWFPNTLTTTLKELAR